MFISLAQNTSVTGQAYTVGEFGGPTVILGIELTLCCRFGYQYLQYVEQSGHEIHVNLVWPNLQAEQLSDQISPSYPV